MLTKSLAMAAALSLAATPAMAQPSAGAPVVGASSANALSVQPPEGRPRGRAVGNPFNAPGAGIGIALFAVIVVLGVLLATGTLFGDDDDQPISA